MNTKENALLNMIKKFNESEQSWSYKLCFIQDVKKFDKMCFFRVRGEIAVYVFTGYNRFTKKYSSYKDSDVNHYREFKKIPL